jgi:hypothetical protein
MPDAHMSDSMPLLMIESIRAAKASTLAESGS